MEKKADTIDITIRKQINRIITLLYMSLFSSLILAVCYIISQILGFFTLKGVFGGNYSYYPVISQAVVGVFSTIAGISIFSFILIFFSLGFEFRRKEIINITVRNEIRQFHFQFLLGFITTLMSFPFAFNRVKTGFWDDVFGLGPFYILENSGRNYNFYFLLARSIAILGLTIVMISFKQLKNINEDIKSKKIPSTKQLEIRNIHIPFAIIQLFVVLDTILRLAISSQYIEITGRIYYLPFSYEIISSVLSVILFIVISTMCFIIIQNLSRNKESFVSLVESFPKKTIPKRRIIKAKKEDILEIVSRME